MTLSTIASGLRSSIHKNGHIPVSVRKEKLQALRKLISDNQI
jgi:hypothetical protein